MTTSSLRITPLFPTLDTTHPLVIAGPCSAESREQVLSTAAELSEVGVRVFRAGAWKPRTAPGSFEGVGEMALPWLVEVRERYGMKVGVEVASAAHATAAIAHGLDFIWIGARTTSNPFTLDEIASVLEGHDLAVLVKNPIAPDMELWLGAIQRLNVHGLTRVAAVHRGFGLGDRSIYRNTPLWRVVLRLRQRCPELPFICDPSHIAGRSSLVAEVAQGAMDRCYQGLILESHCCPTEALSDAEQQLTPQALGQLLSSLRVACCDPCLGDDVERLRQRLDDIDHEIIRLLSERCAISEEIGRWKRQHGRTAFQASRYEEMMADRAAVSQRYGLPMVPAAELFELIHEISLKIQSDLIDNPSPDAPSLQ